uniref:Secreted protein n=1 Tax=Rhipicephalus appendiculatus TaxID=34631 RepID=A0A131YDE6_RHIAP
MHLCSLKNFLLLIAVFGAEVCACVSEVLGDRTVFGAEECCCIASRFRLLTAVFGIKARTYVMTQLYLRQKCVPLLATLFLCSFKTTRSLFWNIIVSRSKPL